MRFVREGGEVCQCQARNIDSIRSPWKSRPRRVLGSVGSDQMRGSPGETWRRIILFPATHAVYSRCRVTSGSSTISRSIEVGEKRRHHQLADSVDMCRLPAKDLASYCRTSLPCLDSPYLSDAWFSHSTVLDCQSCLSTCLLWWESICLFQLPTHHFAARWVSAASRCRCPLAPLDMCVLQRRCVLAGRFPQVGTKLRNTRWSCSGMSVQLFLRPPFLEPLGLPRPHFQFWSSQWTGSAWSCPCQDAVLLRFRHLLILAHHGSSYSHKIQWEQVTSGYWHSAFFAS